MVRGVSLWFQVKRCKRNILLSYSWFSTIISVCSAIQNENGDNIYVVYKSLLEIRRNFLFKCDTFKYPPMYLMTHKYTARETFSKTSSDFCLEISTPLFWKWFGVVGQPRQVEKVACFRAGICSLSLRVHVVHSGHFWRQREGGVIPFGFGVFERLVFSFHYCEFLIKIIWKIIHCVNEFWI